MLEDRTYKATKTERKAVDRLTAGLGDHGQVSVARNDPGETGPLRVEVDGRCWLIHPDGATEEEAA